MATEVLEDSTTTTLEVYPEPLGSYPLSVSVVTYDSGGVELSSGSASVDTVSTTVVSSSGNSSQVLTLTSATGVKVGRKYILSNAEGEVGLVTVSAVSGNVVTCRDPLGLLNAPGAGDTFRGYRCTYTLPAGATATRGVNNRLLWTVTYNDSSVRAYSSIFHVVRTLFADPVTSDEVYAYVARLHPGSAASMTPGRRTEVASRVNRRVRARLLETQRRPHLVGDPDAFLEAGRVALQWVLLDDRHVLVSSDDDLHEQMDSLDNRLGVEIARAIDGMTWIDHNDDNTVDDGEVAPVSTRILL